MSSTIFLWPSSIEFSPILVILVFVVMSRDTALAPRVIHRVLVFAAVTGGERRKRELSVREPLPLNNEHFRGAFQQSLKPLPVIMSAVERHPPLPSPGSMHQLEIEGQIGMHCMYF